ncbi:hypothetical protein U1Q18_026221 [Sarracenia purpurea var. burkii]
MQRFDSPVTARIEANDYADYFRIELLYRTGLAQDAHNPVLLANYAQLFYLYINKEGHEWRVGSGG